MTTLKSFTDIEQSKKLAEILPLESADMHYYNYGNIAKPYIGFDANETRPEINRGIYEYIPCWSLAALLNVLPTIDDEFEPQLHRCLDKYRCTYEGEEDSSGLWRVADNPVDACIEMILKLHEQMIEDFNKEE